MCCEIAESKIIDKRTAGKKPLITIITAVYNAEEYLPMLIESIRCQNNSNYEWIVVDGCSNDQTMNILNDVDDIEMLVDSMPDQGIYDAFNRAIPLARGMYYVVVGADDTFTPDAINVYSQKVIEYKYPDIVLGGVVYGDKVKMALWRPYMGWLGANNVVAGHSVGMLIRCDLHISYGLYSLDYPLCADSLFIKQISKKKHDVVLCKDVVGNFSVNGVSNLKVFEVLCENFLIQLLTEKNKILQCFIFELKILKNINRILKNIK